ncbi:hypothetical protein HBH56_227750 [Parastagonospora nodorum]|uniref:Uncharacterized protein n=1 Tax=Phaeosphaeria nodorum (strain SN15 / ATCC MYA-4574 / FGSC 10173) TaxID=321614 RepID=A0A7U2EZ44_PHANO|nr:hypothetical protein HBH56_227750 [Parastagonospora nodorum]QRC95768.1 hypothetical protein JI435_159200 [Parastagonospora nodorum SN15]KAH3921748.1 hypothetical protein HBH54_235020 [Parastagonospora nodorum]KAH3959114.1 hypothetical protein HBH51_203560 [Parastagonospora nodorum]KAH3963593.1 hypothetical protein HBH52_217880 [Parastagonospora nodorum]
MNGRNLCPCDKQTNENERFKNQVDGWRAPLATTTNSCVPHVDAFTLFLRKISIARRKPSKDFKPSPSSTVALLLGFWPEDPLFAKSRKGGLEDLVASVANYKVVQVNLPSRLRGRRSVVFIFVLGFAADGGGSFFDETSYRCVFQVRVPERVPEDVVWVLEAVARSVGAYAVQDRE